MIESALPFVSVGALIVGITALVVAASALRSLRRAMDLMVPRTASSMSGHPPPGSLGEEHQRSKEEPKRELQERFLETQPKVGGQLGEEQPQTSEWKLQQALEELEQWLRMRSQAQQQAGQQEQERLHKAELQEQLEQEERLEAQQRAKQLEQERLEAQQRAEQLEQERLEAQRRAEQLKLKHLKDQQRAGQLEQEDLEPQ